MSRRIWSGVLAGLIAFSTWVVAAQEFPQDSQPASAIIAQPTDSAPDYEWDGWLNQSDMKVRLASLGVGEMVARELSEEHYPFARWRFLRTRAVTKQAALFFRCSEPLGLSYLFLLHRASGGWRVIDQLELDCHYDDSVSMDVVSIRDPRRDEIVVHHACAGHGSGFLEQDFSVLEVSAGKFRSELVAEEVLRSSPPADSPRDVDRQSTFTVIPIKGSRERAIEQTRTVNFNSQLVRVDRRVFRWAARKSKYVPSAFSKVEAAAQ